MKTENADQDVYVHCSLVRNYTACSMKLMLFDQTAHGYIRLFESVYLHFLSIRQWELISMYLAKPEMANS